MRFQVGLLLIIVFATGVTAQKLVFATQDKPDFPHVTGEGTQVPADKPGAAVELVRMLEKELGVSIEIRRFPWTRCLEVELRNGTADGVFLASWKPERAEFGRYPQLADGSVDSERRVTTLSYSFFKLKGSSWNWDGKNLGGLRGMIGVPGGYSIAGELEGMGAKVLASGSTATNFRNLLLGRLVLVATLSDDGDYCASLPEFAGMIEKVPVPIVTKPYYIMLSRQFLARDPALAERLWNKVAELRERWYARLVEAYFLER